MSIGETIGTVVKPKDVGEMRGGNFMRVHVEVDITNPYVEGGRSLGVVRGIIGCLLCMNVCRTFVTGVGKSLMMTKIAFYGLVVKELYS